MLGLRNRRIRSNPGVGREFRGPGATKQRDTSEQAETKQLRKFHLALAQTAHTTRIAEAKKRLAISGQQARHMTGEDRRRQARPALRITTVEMENTRCAVQAQANCTASVIARPCAASHTSGQAAPLLALLALIALVVSLIVGLALLHVVLLVRPAAGAGCRAPGDLVVRLLASLTLRLASVVIVALLHSCHESLLRRLLRSEMQSRCATRQAMSDPTDRSQNRSISISTTRRRRSLTSGNFSCRRNAQHEENQEDDQSRNKQE